MAILGQRGRCAILLLLGCCHLLSCGVGAFQEERWCSINKSIRFFEPGRSKSVLSSKWRKFHRETEVELVLKTVCLARVANPRIIDLYSLYQCSNINLAFKSLCFIACYCTFCFRSIPQMFINRIIQFRPFPFNIHTSMFIYVYF